MKSRVLKKQFGDIQAEISFFHSFQMSGDFFCKICEIACTGKVPFEQHLQSAKHIKKAQTSTTPTSPNPPVIRSVSSTSTAEDSPSITSTPISSETMRILLEWNHPRGYKPYCDICHLPLHGENNADVHFQSNNLLHQQKLAIWKKIQEADALYSCAVCSEIFHSENQMRDHFVSDPHRTMVEQKNFVKKIILIYQTCEKLKQARRENNGKFNRRKSLSLYSFNLDRQASTRSDDLSNMLDNMKIFDGIEQKSKVKQTGIFSQDKLQDIINRKVIKDDDD